MAGATDMKTIMNWLLFLGAAALIVAAIPVIVVRDLIARLRGQYDEFGDWL